MRTFSFLLPGLLASFACLAQPAKPRPATKIIYNNHLLGLMTSELTVKHLRQVYGKELRVDRTFRNEYESEVRDMLLVAKTGPDKLEIFKNKYNAFLLSAKFTSRRLAFGHGIQVGATKAAFCKAFGLKPGYDLYLIVENPEGGYDIAFRFKQEKLAEVSYRTNYVD